LSVANKCNHVILATSLSLDPTLRNSSLPGNDNDKTVVISNCTIKRGVPRHRPSLASTARALYGAPMPQYLNALTLATNQAIADTGATSIFKMDGAPVNNKRVTQTPLTINLPDGKKIYSTHINDIHIPGLPTVLTGHIVPRLTIASLIGIWPICKAGCTVTFDNEKCDIKYNGRKILTVFKDPTTDLWTLPIPANGRVRGDHPITNSRKSHHCAQLVQLSGKTSSRAGHCNGLEPTLPKCSDGKFFCSSNGVTIRPLYGSCPPPNHHPDRGDCGVHTLSTNVFQPLSDQKLI
jgi:hypothetical protein